MDQLALEGLCRLREELRRPATVAQGPVGQTKTVAGLDLEREVPYGAGDSDGALTRFDGVVRGAHRQSVGALVDGDPSQPPWVFQRAGEGLGFLQVRIHPLALSEWVQRVAQVEAEIDGLFARAPALGELPQRLERLLEVRQCLPVRR